MIFRCEKMNIAILSWILDIQRTGINNYLYNLVMAMIEDGKSRDISLIHFQKSNDDIYKEVNDVIIGSSRGKIVNPFSLSKSLKTNEIDVLHLPSHMFPQVSPFYINTNVKKVLTIHDLIPLLYCKKLPFHYKFWTSTLKIIKNRPDSIITDSMNTKKDLINFLKIPEEKITVIPLAHNKNYKPLKNKSIIKKELELKYSIHLPFILYVGSIEVRKNILLLFKSFYKLLKKGVKSNLVLIGSPGYGFEDMVKTVNELGLSKNVFFLGYVPDQDMVKFYNTAELFVFPSFYEGFGLPPLEAMACGCPVITSNTSSLPEVVGNAGFTLDPNDYNAFAESMYQVLTNESLKTEMTKKSLKRAKLFSWENTAKETWQVYEDVL